MTDAPFGLTGVSVAFDRGPALTSVDLPAVPGEVTALIGADGAGKSTACRVLVGLLQADVGEVRRPPRRKVGYQPESAGTWPELTVGENIGFVARAHGFNEPGRVDELLEVAGLTGAVDRLASRLSGGMRQKLAVVMAVLARPQLVVLDEPTTGLDPVSRAEVWRLLLRTAAEGAAVLATTSYLDEAERANGVVILDAGVVIASGSAESIRQSFVGTVSVASERPSDAFAWRRGRNWRVWTSHPVDGRRSVAPDLEDVVTVTAYQRRMAS